MAIDWGSAGLGFGTGGLLGGGLFGGGDDPPPPPDPYKAASDQYNLNWQSAFDQNLLNQANQFTPYGSLTYETAFDRPGYTEALSEWEDFLGGAKGKKERN